MTKVFHTNMSREFLIPYLYCGCASAEKKDFKTFEKL